VQSLSWHELQIVAARLVAELPAEANTITNVLPPVANGNSD
jgi:hypothetical protein